MAREVTRAFAAIAVLLAAVRAQANPTVETVLPSTEAPSEGLTGSMDISDNGLLLGMPGNLFDVATRKPLLRAAVPGLSSFVIADDGTLLTISNQKLGGLSNQSLVERIPLPSRGMKLARGAPGQILIYGGQAPADKSIFAFQAAKYEKLVEADGTITALASAGTQVHFATGNRIYRFEYGQPLELVMVLPKEISVRSLAVAPDHGALYLVAHRHLYVAGEHGLELVAADAADAVAVHGNLLYVLDAKQRRLFRLQGVSGPTEKAPTVAEPPPLPTHATVAAVEASVRGRRFAEAGDWAHARTEYEAAMAAAPNWAEPFWALAILSERTAFYGSNAGTASSSPIYRDGSTLGSASSSARGRLSDPIRFYQGFLDRSASNDPRNQTARERVARLSKLQRDLAVKAFLPRRRLYPYDLDRVELLAAAGARLGTADNETLRQAADAVGADPDAIRRLQVSFALGVLARIGEKTLVGAELALDGVRSGTVGSAPSVYVFGYTGLVLLRRELVQSRHEGSFSALYVDAGAGLGYYSGELRAPTSQTDLSTTAFSATAGLGASHYWKAFGCGVYLRYFAHDPGDLSPEIPGLTINTTGVDLLVHASLRL